MAGSHPAIGLGELESNLGEEISLYKWEGGHYRLQCKGDLGRDESGFFVGCFEDFGRVPVYNGDRIGIHKEGETLYYDVKGL